MAVQTVYYAGGYVPAAPAGNKKEQYDGGAGTYTAWNADGTVASTRALTASESSALSSVDATATSAANQTTINQRLANHRTQLLNWIAANPNGAVLTAAQTLILAQMLIDLTDADLGLLSDLSGT